jgi:hypothetical protein
MLIGYMAPGEPAPPRRGLASGATFSNISAKLFSFCPMGAVSISARDIACMFDVAAVGQTATPNCCPGTPRLKWRPAQVQGQRSRCQPSHTIGGFHQAHVDHHRSNRCRSQRRVVPDAAWPAAIGSCPRRLRSDPRRRWHCSALPAWMGRPRASTVNPARPTAGQRPAAVFPG